MKTQEPFQSMQIPQPAGAFKAAVDAPPDGASAPAEAVIFKSVRRNIVQSIRAFHVADLQAAAASLNNHFLYANLSDAHTKQDVLESIGKQFLLPAHYGKNFDALYDCMTDPIAKSGAQIGFVLVLERIPATSRFDREAREQLLDIFRDAAEYWAERNVPFRCFYSFL